MILKRSLYNVLRMMPVMGMLLLLFTATPLHAQPSLKQKKEQLQKQMKKLQNDINLIQAAIKKNTAQKEQGMNEILALQAKIRSRQRLIDNINDQIGGLDENIGSAQVQISTDSARVVRMKADYGKMLAKTYENILLQNETSFLLSAEDFQEAMRRYNYLLKIAQYRIDQAKAIQQAMADLQQKKTELQGTKQEKIELLQQQTSQKGELEQEKKEKDNAVAKLKGKEQLLRKQAAEKSKAAQQMNAKIQDIIEEEIRLAKKAAAERAKKNPATTTTTKKNDAMPMTPAEQALSNDFENNKGKLPWPVVRGHVVSEFGKHEHPVLKNVMVENNGIDIQAEKGAEARAVFSGSVVSVFSMPTTQNCIIIKHGEYFTVYSNIESTNIKPGQTVTTKQDLGLLHTDKNESLSKVHIEIWKGKEKLDPEQWLAN